MKICIFGKYPPIQGGVSMRTYWVAHGLARLGHTVHVITNADEVAMPYRMFMREEDWGRCEGRYGTGSVTVHWTEAYGRRQWHIPESAPYVTKLASIGLELARKQGFELIYSYYVEPYGVAAHLVAQATGLPHVVRTAGSDAGRLWSLPQFAALYDHIFKSAAAVLCSQSVVAKMVEIGAEPSRVIWDFEKHVNLLDLFAPDGPALDVGLLRDRIRDDKDDRFRGLLFGEFDPSLRYFGTYGKLGKSKSTPSLLAALKRMKDRGFPAGLLVMAHDRPGASDSFRDYVKTNGLEERVCQLPFLPHWRVAELIRRCVAVCCLEQDFPITFHDPVTAREVLTCGACMIGSAEIIAKLPEPQKLRDGYNCIAVSDTKDASELERQMISVLDRPGRVEQIRRNARQYAVELEAGNTFPRRLAAMLGDIARKGNHFPKNGHRQPSVRRVDVIDAGLTPGLTPLHGNSEQAASEAVP